MNTTPTRLPRRDFLRRGTLAATATAAVALSAAPRPAPAAPVLDPDERFQFGFVGLGVRGTELLREFVATGQVLVTWVCDADGRAARKAADFVKQTQTRPFKTTPDFRRVVEDRRVQAVVIAAPHHVHAPAAVAALKANKHVYLEQPVSHNAREGEMILDAQRRGKSIFQAGLQRRSVPWIAQVIRRVQQDEFGRVRFARAWYTDRRESLGFGQLAPVPADLDFLLWQGPAPDRPYRDNLIPGNWRWFWHWGTGELGAQGVPWLDLARWGLQVDCPTRVASSGGRYHFEDDQETPDTQVVTYDFGDRSLVWEHRSCQSTPSEGEPYGVAFYGAKATLVLGPKGYRLLDLAGKETEAVAGEVPTTPHVANFIECFTNRARTPAANAEDAHKSCLLAHLGNLAQRAGETVFLNPKTLQLREPKPAMARLWSREYRPGWNPAA